MATLSELTVQVLTARLTKKEMTLEELQKEMVAISSMIKAIDDGTGTNPEPIAEIPVEVIPEKINFKKIFKDKEVICLICNKGFKTLKRHLSMAHDLKPGEYRKQFGISSKQTLAAKNYVESRRQMALDKGLGAGLVKYRADKAAKKDAVPVEKAKTPTKTKEKVTAPAKKAKAPAKEKAAEPTIKTKAAVPAVKVKAPVPVVKEKVAVPAKVAKKK